MRPLVGITSNITLETVAGRPSDAFRLRTPYTVRIAEAGGAPVILPLADDDVARDILARLDGLILSGGDDIPPQFFNAEPNPRCHYMPVERWHSERRWLRSAEDRHVPVLGICLGMQVMNVAAGGTLIQDLPTERPDATPHTGPGDGRLHEVILSPESRLAGLAPGRSMAVTCAHHQAVDVVGGGYRVAATARDGIVEAIEWEGPDFRLGVQWHPERCPDQPNWLLRGFVDLCGQRASQRGE